MNQFISLLLLSLVSFNLYADDASQSCDVDGMLRDLQSQVTGPLSPGQQSDARRILGGYCSEKVAQAVAVTEEKVRTELTKEEEPLKVFGIELRKADKDSIGHKRLRNRK